MCPVAQLTPGFILFLHIAWLPFQANLLILLSTSQICEIYPIFSIMFKLYYEANVSDQWSPLQPRGCLDCRECNNFLLHLSFPQLSISSFFISIRTELFSMFYSQVAEQDRCPGCVGDLHHGEEEDVLEGQGECSLSQPSDTGQGRHAARTDRQHHRCWQGTSAGQGNQLSHLESKRFFSVIILGLFNFFVCWRTFISDQASPNLFGTLHGKWSIWCLVVVASFNCYLAFQALLQFYMQLVIPEPCSHSTAGGSEMRRGNSALVRQYCLHLQFYNVLFRWRDLPHRDKPTEGRHFADQVSPQDGFTSQEESHHWEGRGWAREEEKDAS